MLNSNHDSIKNYFPLPNQIFSLDPCPCEIAVYSYLLRCEDRKNFQCWPSYKTIGKSIGASENTVRKYLGRLVDKSLIVTEPTSVFTQDGMKRNGTLRYTILPIQKPIDFYNQQQFDRVDEDNRLLLISSLLIDWEPEDDLPF